MKKRTLRDPSVTRDPEMTYPELEEMEASRQDGANSRCSLWRATPSCFVKWVCIRELKSPSQQKHRTTHIYGVVEWVPPVTCLYYKS